VFVYRKVSGMKKWLFFFFFFFFFFTAKTEMKVSWILASSQNGVIGKEGKLPWSLPEDLKLFRKLTTGHHVVMGRKTFQSIGRPLPNRTNLILTRTLPSPPSLFLNETTSIHYFTSLQEAIRFAKERGEEELMLIGGESLFEESKPLVARIYLTRVHADIPDGDTFFDLSFIDNNPTTGGGEGWNEETSRTLDFPADETNQFPFTHQVYSRTTSS
jgi:dihydrofolate reductase